MSNVDSMAVHDYAVTRQRAYYEATAESYDTAHVERGYIVALHLLAGYVELAGVKGVLDVGAGDRSRDAVSDLWTADMVQDGKFTNQAIDKGQVGPVA
jgi:hypothetical protein